MIQCFALQGAGGAAGGQQAVPQVAAAALGPRRLRRSAARGQPQRTGPLRPHYAAHILGTEL